MGIKVHFSQNKLTTVIKDTGKGMSSSQIQRAQEAFGNIDVQGRTETTTGDLTQGIGLGISTSIALAKAMKGNLRIQSIRKVRDEGDEQGTTVTIEIEAYPVGHKVEVRAHKKKERQETQKQQMFGEALDLQEAQKI